MNENPFKSFWMAGYECSDQLNCFGNRADLLESSGHLHLMNEDYKDLAQFEIKTVREGIRWSHVETRPYVYDWSTVIFMFEKAKANNIQQVWDICHFGYADDLTPLHPMFARRFAALCRAFATLYKKHFPQGGLIVTPINEVSFISWLGGDAKGTTPYCHGQGWDVKYHLMKAYIEGVVAMKEVDPTIKILSTEPLVNIVAPVTATPQMLADAAGHHEAQFQAMDILTGKICPELGGSPEYLDMAGFNYYYNNQWILENHIYLNWKEQPVNLGWQTLTALLKKAYQRYACPLVISETSHSGIDRPQWINYIGEECKNTLQQGIPLLGICLYPIIDRTDWDYPERWHHSGLWDAEIKDGAPPARILYKPYADALKRVQQLMRVPENKNSIRVDVSDILFSQGLDKKYQRVEL